MTQSFKAQPLRPAPLLTSAQSARADAAAIAAGTPGAALMERAGAAVADAVLARRGGGRALVLAGPGNNGGDGFVAARLLRAAGWTVTVAALVPRAALKGDAAVMAARWDGPLTALDEADHRRAEVIIDALFGAGLDRHLEGAAAAAIRAANGACAFKLAVDMPSGIASDSGAVLGAAFAADMTVTFAAKKPGHLLYPGRGLCGRVKVADIGIIPGEGVGDAPPLHENTPALWREALPRLCRTTHKYRRGHAAVVGGAAWHGGAARLAAAAALHAGAGLVTLIARPQDCDLYAAHLTAVMLRPCADAPALPALLADKRVGALALGPGMGNAPWTREMVLAALATGKPLVLDADALTVFEGAPEALFKAVRGPAVITPHEGEFARLFPDLGAGPKQARARAAAARAGVVVVLKGADTVIAAPDGGAAINANAPPWLATAGAGDVLCGVILALLAQGAPAFAAAAAGVWAHGAAARAAGPGMTAEDLLSPLGRVCARLASTSPLDKPQA
ncbi:MAG: NAD(P)H-hydrate dehydratase [Pseudomonadota bacterium]